MSVCASMQSLFWHKDLELFTWFMLQLDSFHSAYVFWRKMNEIGIGMHLSKSGPASTSALFQAHSFCPLFLLKLSVRIML